MNKSLIILCLFALLAATVSAADYVDTLLNNQYLVESDRLVKLAEKSLAEGKFEDAVKYAAQAEQQAQLSDEYVALQKKIKDANDAISAAQARMDSAKAAGAEKTHADAYAEADKTLAQAITFRTGEKWDDARTTAQRVLVIMAAVPDKPALPAQYVVSTWAKNKDCFWNISGKPEIYGNPFQWQRLYNANKSKLPNPNNPNVIEPGTVLDIPSIRGEVRSGVMQGE